MGTKKTKGKATTFVMDPLTRAALDELQAILPLNQTAIIKLAVQELAERKRKERKS